MSKLKKSTIKTVIALILCFTTLVITAFAATQNLSSYETFKESMLKMNAIDNVTIDGKVKVLIDGVESLSADYVSKIEKNLTTTSSKSSYTINGKEMTATEQWTNSEKIISKNSDSDTYFISPNYNNIENFMVNTTAFDNSGTSTTSIYVDGDIDGESAVTVSSYAVHGVVASPYAYENYSLSEQKLMNAAIDMIVGDVKNYFTTNGNTIMLNLEKNQIPQIIQLLVSVVAEQTVANRDLGMMTSDVIIQDDLSAFADTLPMFTDDTAVQSANISATLDDNKNITALNGVVTIVGTDTDGVSHTVTLSFDLTISDIGTTVADTIDLTGKKTEEVNFFNLASAPIEIAINEIEVE